MTRTKPQKYGEPTTIISFTTPISVREEMNRLCEQEGLTSRSELITKMIHAAYLQQNDPVLSVEKMKEKQQEIEEKKIALEKECMSLYGRSLPEQELYLQAQEKDRLLQAKQRNETRQQQEKDRDTINLKRPQVQATLTEYFRGIRPDKARVTLPLKEKGLLNIWRQTEARSRERIISKAVTEAGWTKDNFGKWTQQPNDLMYR